MMKTVKSIIVNMMPGPVAQSVTSLATDPGATSSIPARSHTFMEIDHELIYIVILLPLIKEGLMSVNMSEIIWLGVLTVSTWP